MEEQTVRRAMEKLAVSRSAPVVEEVEVEESTAGAASALPLAGLILTPRAGDFDDQTPSPDGGSPPRTSVDRPPPAARGKGELPSALQSLVPPRVASGGALSRAPTPSSRASTPTPAPSSRAPTPAVAPLRPSRRSAPPTHASSPLSPSADAGAAEDAPTLGWDGVSLAAWPRLEAAAEAELGETAASRTEALRQLRAELGKLAEYEQPLDMSDRALLSMLRARKLRVDVALRTLIAARQFQNKHAGQGWFEPAPRGAEFWELYAAGFMRVLSGRDRKGRRVSILLPMRLPGGEEVQSQAAVTRMLMRWNFWALDRLSRDPYFQVHGAVILENFERMSLMQALRMRSTLPHATMQAMLFYIQSCAAYRLAGIHVVHQPAFMSFLWTIVRPFLGEKMRKRIFFHGANIDSLADVMDASLLPPEMGGTCADDPMRWLDEEIEKENAELLQRAAR